jgi:hypothetical protein
MAKHDERDGDGKFRSGNRDNAGVDGPVPSRLVGEQVRITGELGSGRGGIGDLNTYVQDSEYSSAHNYDVGQQDTDKARSR